MYEELVKPIRFCSCAVTCIGCPYVHECRGENLLQKAADAIEDLNKIVEQQRDILAKYGGETEIRQNSEYTIKYFDLIGKIPRWIPVTERLPEKPEGYPMCQLRRTYYLVALESGCVETLGYEFHKNCWQITGSPVTHWMPLPEPPEEET